MPLPVPLASTQASRTLLFHPRVAEEAHRLLSTRDDALAAQLQHALTAASHSPQHIILRYVIRFSFDSPKRKCNSKLSVTFTGTSGMKTTARIPCNLIRSCWGLSCSGIHTSSGRNSPSSSTITTTTLNTIQCNTRRNGMPSRALCTTLSISSHRVA